MYLQKLDKMFQCYFLWPILFCDCIPEAAYYELSYHSFFLIFIYRSSSQDLIRFKGNDSWVTLESSINPL